MRIRILTIIALFLLAPALASAATVRSLSAGMSGADVTALQEVLITKGYLSTAATGYFGPATTAAVKKFQCANGIVCSGAAYGLVGPATRAALGLGGSGLEVSGWIPYWRAAVGSADAEGHMSAFSSIMPFGYVVQNDGSINDAFGLSSPVSTTSAALLSSAKNANVKVVPTVMWSNGSAISAILSNASTRQALEDRVANLVTANGFAGIDIDFENKTAETKNYFSTFLKGLRMRLGTKLLYCAVEPRTPVADRYDGTPPADATEYANDYAAIGRYCDRVEIMAYDQQTADVALDKAKTAAGGPYVPIADPDWVKAVVNLAAQSIPKSKIVIGIPTYGYEWQVTPLQISGFSFDLQWAFNPRYATALAASLGITPTRNEAGELSFIYNPAKVPAAVAAAAAVGETTASSGTGLTSTTPSYRDGASLPAADGTYNIVWWEDAKAVADKIALAKTLGVAGVAFFKLDGSEDPGIWATLPAR
ncbi:MAG: peptidoglycan-binding protein [Patescibacteria group bacterium]|nr:peptidoglycan-binding protein [Patescibacteria group bacterium]MDE1944305.1 peptidoglycan-binding protein [Patescibacteria group bacterium]MDE1945296.1 peptidoglycan-binding protein [Patescibacteria group bacterium]MDE2057873.1 peptidoglycan-binding protein [Patescibacteria group bacterium]